MLQHLVRAVKRDGTQGRQDGDVVNLKKDDTSANSSSAEASAASGEIGQGAGGLVLVAGTAGRRRELYIAF